MVRMSKARLVGLFALMCTLLAPMAAWAQTYTYSIYVNSDANPGTGCSEGPVAGVEVRLQVTATGGQTPQVQQVTRARCSGGSFGASSAIAGSYPIGTNNGIAGSDVIELADALSELSSSGSPSLVYSIVATSNAGEDDLLTSTGVAGGPPIVLGLPAVQLPGPGLVALLLLAVLLMAIGVRAARRSGLWRLVALLSILGGVAIAANFVVDGQVGDWNGVNPLATDPAGDASSGESAIDLRAFFSAIENGRVYFRVDVTNLENNGPTAIAGSVTTLEDEAVGISLTGQDNENDPLTFAIIAAPANGVLGAIVPTGPQSASVQYTPNADSNGSDSFTFTVDDGQVTSAPATIAITVTSVNDVPAFTAGADQSVLEDAGAQSVAGWATAISAGPANEAGQALDFIVSNDNTALFSAQPAVSAAGVLTYTPAPDANGSATVTLSLHDNGGTANGGVDTSAAQTFTITVGSVNDAPSFVAGPDQSIAENSPAQTIDPWATALSAGAANESGQTLNFTVSNDNNALFSVQPAVSPTGVLTYTPAAIVNGSATVTVTLVDDGGTANGGVDTSAPQTFTISVVGVNDPPSFTAGPDQTVGEDAGAQTVDPWATAISPGPPNETGQAVSFNVTGNSNPALFSAGPAISPTGVLTYTPADDAFGSASITLVAVDDGGTANGGNDTSPPQTFQITVTAVNDAPELDLNGAAAGTGFSTSFTEGNPAIAIVDTANLSLSDVDNANLASATVSIGNLLDGTAEVLAANTGGTAISANYTAATGILALSGSDTVANYQTVLRSITYRNNSTAPTETARTINFVANDGASNSNIATSVVGIVGINAIPSFTGGAAVVVNEDAGAQSVANWATAIDDNDGGGQTLSFTVTPTGGSLAFSSAPAISPTGTLTFTTATNASGSATFDVVLTDSGSNNNTSAAQVLSITANAVNDAPAFTPGGTQTVPEDTGAQTVNGWATGISPGPADEAGQTVSFSITGNTNPALFSVAPAVSPTGTLTYTPAADAFGSATISLVLVDNGGTANGGIDTSAPQTFDINITGVNDAPAFSAGPNQAVDDNAGAQSVNPWATAITPGPANEGGQSVSFVIDSNSAPGIFSAGPAISATGVLTYTPATVPTGTTTATIVLHAMDDGGTANGGINVSGTQSFTIAISHANTVPVLTNPVIAYATAGNTQLQVAGASLPGLVAIPDPDSALAKSLPVDPDGPSAPSVIPDSGTSSNGGDYSIDATGAFTYVPPAGFAGVDSFSFQVTDMNTPTPGIVAGTINITVGPTVWYVSNRIDADNPAGGDGRSNNAFDALAGAQTASADGDILFVFDGNSSTTPLTGGIVLKNGQRLWGEGYGLVVAPFGTLVPAGAQPRINAASSDAVSVPASAGPRIGVEIRGLDLQGTPNAIDVTSSGANGVGVLINGNTIRGSVAEGIDVNFGATGVQNAAIQSNTVTAGTTGIDVRRTAGTATLTAFDGNAVSGNTGGAGIVVDGMTFDATPGGSISTVNGGVTVIGSAGNGVGAGGLILTNVVGDLAFNDLDIVNDGGTGLSVSSSGALNAVAGTGFRIAVTPGAGSIVSAGGPAADISNASTSLPLGTVSSASSATTGISLVNAFGGAGSTAFSASGGLIADPAGASGSAFVVNGGDGNVSYPGTINSNAGNAVTVLNRSSGAITFSGSITDLGGGILLTSNAGAAISFSGQLALTTGANPAFTATGGGTVVASNVANTATTTLATALNVAGTTIGAGGLVFRSISAGTAAGGPVSGIVLSNTGTLGGLTVAGTGALNSGGTIQQTTGRGVSLTSTRGPSFANMRIQNTASHGIGGTQVTNFSFTNGSINNSGTGLGPESANIAFNSTASGTENNLDGVVVITGNTLTDSYYHGIDIFNFSGTISDATLSNNTITSTTSTATSLGSGIRLVAFGSAGTVASVTRATIANNVVLNFPSGAGIQAQGGNANAAGAAGIFGVAGNASNVIAISGNRVSGSSPINRMGTNAIIATVNGRGQGNFNISNNGTVANPVGNTLGTALVLSSFGLANVTATVNGNVIVANNMFASQGIGAGTGITFAATDTPSLAMDITNNSISQTDGNGMLVVARGATGAVRARIQNNTVAAPLGANRNGIRIDSGNGGSVNDSVCLNISGNISAGSGATPEGIGLRKQGAVAGTNNMAFHGFATSPASAAQATAYVTAQNPGSASGTFLLNGDNFNSPTCNLP